MRALLLSALLAFPFATSAAAEPRRSLVYDDGARHACYLHIGQTKKRLAGGRRLIISDMGASDCDALPERARACRNGRMWPDTGFARDGECPAWFVQTHGWEPEERGAPTGWDFTVERAEEGAPYLMTLRNDAAGRDDPCAHHEINFNYNFPGQSFRNVDGRPARLGDADDVRFGFDARIVEATPSPCARLPRALVKVSIVLRWYDRTGARPRYLAQTSIAVIMFDRDDLMDVIQTRRGEALDQPIVFDNSCTANRVYAQSRACMISLDGPDVAQPQIDGTMRRFVIPVSKLAERYRERLEPTIAGRRLRLEDAEFKSVQLISAVNGADLTFQMREPRVTGEIVPDRLR